MTYLYSAILAIIPSAILAWKLSLSTKRIWKWKRLASSCFDVSLARAFWYAEREKGLSLLPGENAAADDMHRRVISGMKNLIVFCVPRSSRSALCIMSIVHFDIAAHSTRLHITAGGMALGMTMLVPVFWLILVSKSLIDVLSCPSPTRTDAAGRPIYLP